MTVHDEPARLSALVDRLAARSDVPHVVVAVERMDGSPVWSGAAGHADEHGTPMRDDTPYFLASIDKLYTASLILKLEEQGRIDLDRPVTAYLPSSVTAGLHRWDGADRTGAITVGHLLAHASGLADWLEDRPRGGSSLVDRLLDEGDRVMSLNDIAGYVREQLAPHFPPQPLDGRGRVRYSDTNYMLLAGVLESVTGLPLHRLHREMLYEPLELWHTWMPGHSRPLKPTAEPAALWAGTRTIDIPLMMRSIGGLYATAGDALRFVRALVTGRVFERPGTLARMQARWRRFGLPRDRAALRSPQWPIEYGLGMMRFRLPRWLSPFQAVPTLVGHTGSTGSWLFHCPERDLLIAGTVDQVTAGALPFRFVPKLLGALRPA